MQHIETSGNYRQMGRQLGETFAEQFAQSFERFVPKLPEELERHRPAIGRVRDVLLRHCPEVNDETDGIAEVLGMDRDLVLGLRYFNELRTYLDDGCSGLFIADSDRGPLLMRTCDLERRPDIVHSLQLSRINRPDGGTATLTVGYLALTGPLGINQFGVATTASSMHARPTPGRDGLPSAVINHCLLRDCRSVADVMSFTDGMTMRGKGVVMIVGDDGGASAMLELPSGAPIVRTPRPEQRDWQACSNLCFSPSVVEDGSGNYIRNAYLRYGRITHMLADGGMPRTLEAVKQLARDIAQPGSLVGDDARLHTSYAYVIELRNHTMHIASGHPCDVDFEALQL